MELDQRILRVGVEVGGQLRVYDSLHVNATGAKYANPLQDECAVTIYNMTRDVRSFLLTETSPFNKNRTPKRLRVEAGRRSSGLSLVFEGDITEAFPTEGPDIGVELRAKTGQFAKGNVVAVSQAAQAPLSRIARQVADSLEATLAFEAADKQIANYTFTGGALKQIEQLERAGNVDAFLDGRVLTVKDKGVALRGVTHTLSAASGMVGMPEQTEKGVKVMYLFDPKSRIGGRLQIESQSNPSLTGAYTIFKLGFDLSNFDTPFYSTAEANRTP